MRVVCELALVRVGAGPQAGQWEEDGDDGGDEGVELCVGCDEVGDYGEDDCIGKMLAWCRAQTMRMRETYGVQRVSGSP